MFHDLTQAGLGVCAVDDLALTVLATIVSERVTEAPAGQARRQYLIDAGKKTLTPDRRYGQDGYGLVRTENEDTSQCAHPDLLLTNLSEEHGWLDAPIDCPFKIGDRLRILVNHSCVVASTQSELVEIEGSEVVGKISVDARGASV